VVGGQGSGRSWPGSRPATEVTKGVGGEEECGCVGLA
jgi:hypothetical protein